MSGSAQNPLTLNRYLYANANPATLVDPDGHAAAKCIAWGYVGSGLECTAYSAAQVRALKKVANSYLAQSSIDDEQGYYQAEDTYAQSVAATDLAAQQAAAAAEASRWATEGAALPGAEQPHDSGCDWNPFSGNSCEGQLAGGVGNKLGDFAGGVGNGARWLAANPLVDLALVGVVSCLAGALADPVCDGIVLGAIAGGGGYALGHTDLPALAAGKDPFSNWNWTDAANTASIGAIGGAVGGAWTAGMKGWMGAEAANYPAWATAVPNVTVGGGLGVAASLLLNHSTGNPSDVNDLCTTLTGFLSGKGQLAGMVCGLMK